MQHQGSFLKIHANKKLLYICVIHIDTNFGVLYQVMVKISVSQTV